MIYKQKRVLLPGLEFKDLKFLNKFIFPSNIIVPMFFISLIAQISDSMKEFVNAKDIQQVFSVKLYSKVLYSSLNTNYLTSLQSISKTLAFEIPLLSVLSVKERIIYVNNLVHRLLSTKGQARVYLKDTILRDPKILIKHRRGLSLQARTVMASVPLFSPYSICLGISVRDISITNIIDSARELWVSLGLEHDEFDFSLYKQAYLIYFTLSLDKVFSKPVSLEDCIRILIYAEIKNLVFFHNSLVLVEDNILLRGDNNLTILEQFLGFLHRPIS